MRYFRNSFLNWRKPKSKKFKNSLYKKNSKRQIYLTYGRNRAQIPVVR